jgi:ribonuclease BN (tRNA processing enzyme)
MMTTKVVLLGTGTPNPSPKRSGPSIALIVDEKVYLVDFGAGVVRRAIEAGIKPPQLTTAFLTHFHSDHTVGYPDLIFTPAVVGRSVPLNVYGPRGLTQMTNHILEAYKMDIEERVNGLEPTTRDGYVVNTNEILDNDTSVVYGDENVSVEAFPVVHGSWPAFGFKFTSSDKTVVVSGDTAPTSTIIEKADGCDVLIHEVYSSVSIETRPPEWKKYHSSVHTSTHELAEIASQAKPKLLVLYHQLCWNRTDDELLEEIRERYTGEVVSGNDLDVF